MKFTTTSVRHIIALSAFASLCLTTTTLADDAIAFDYKTGVYGGYWSTTPEGGADFRHGSAAKGLALLNAKNRGGLSPIIVWDSNLTGYFSVALGLNRQNSYYIAVAEGSTQAEADTRAVHILLKFDTMKRASVVCEYFSYGSK